MMRGYLTGNHAEEPKSLQDRGLTNNDRVDFARQRHSMSHWTPLENSDIFSKTQKKKKGYKSKTDG